MLTINYLAVFVAAIAAFVLGFLFHGPLFGKLWMRLANIHPTGKEKMSDMYGKMFWNFVANLVTALVLAIIYLIAATSFFTDGPSISTGIICGFLVWIGFLVTSSSMDPIWMGKSWKLWFFEACSSFVVMLVMGIIIAAWR